MIFKITKYIHSCLLVETDGRVALFDPGVMSTPFLDINTIKKLDDIFITHGHPDHFDIGFIKKLVAKFTDVRITTTPEVVEQLKTEGIQATSKPSEGITFFDSPHENVRPIYPQPDEIGIHYLDKLSDPGDSHSFHETKAILALPITGPWGSNIKALNLALELKPHYVLPIHDWHWRDEAREQAYAIFETILGDQGITFFKLKTGQPVEISLQ